MANSFTLGQLVRMTATFAQNSTAVDPAVVTLIVEEPDDNVLTISSTQFTNPSVGTFYYEYDAAKSGLVEYRWKSTAPQGAKESWFTVDKSRVDNP